MQENTQEKSPIKQKILEYLKKMGVSSYEFYLKSGVTRGVLSQNNGISEDNIARFLAYAPSVSSEWLLRGEEPMLRTEGGASDDTPATVPVASAAGQSPEPLVADLITKIATQAEEIGRLKARIEELERRRGDDAGRAQIFENANVG